MNGRKPPFRFGARLTGKRTPAIPECGHCRTPRQADTLSASPIIGGARLKGFGALRVLSSPGQRTGSDGWLLSF